MTKYLQAAAVALGLLTNVSTSSVLAQSDKKMSDGDNVAMMNKMSTEHKAAMFDKMSTQDKMAAMKISGHDVTMEEKMAMMNKMSTKKKAGMFDKMPMSKKMMIHDMMEKEKMEKQP